MIILKKIKKNKGFVILFAVSLAALLLSIALGVANIALKEVKFGTSAKDTNNAFFAADSGAECALNYDKFTTSSNAFTGSASMTCNQLAIPISVVSTNMWNFIVPQLGSSNQSCANVTVDKTDPTKTVITSKGYNIGNTLCLSSNPDRIERVIVVTY